MLEGCILDCQRQECRRRTVPMVPEVKAVRVTARLGNRSESFDVPLGVFVRWPSV